MSNIANTLSARRLQGFATHLAASSTGVKSASEGLTKKYIKQAATRDRKHAAIRETILSGLKA